MVAFWVILVIALVLAVLSVWFPPLKKFLLWLIIILCEIFYFSLFWWWWATIRKAMKKSYPKAFPFKIPA